MNVFPSEIERVARELDFVGTCAAFEKIVNGKTQIKLVIEGTLTEKQREEVRKYIGKNLSHWHIPGIVTTVDKMPYTAIGKIDYVKLQNID